LFVLYRGFAAGATISGSIAPRFQTMAANKPINCLSIPVRRRRGRFADREDRLKRAGDNGVTINANALRVMESVPPSRSTDDLATDRRIPAGANQRTVVLRRKDHPDP
jgi:hypothetical protein